MLACTLYAAFLIRKLISGKEPPVFAVMAKYMAVCCLFVTFLVVTAAVLAPMNGLKGYQMMLFLMSFFYHHLLSPVLLAALSFLFSTAYLSLLEKASLRTHPYCRIRVCCHILLNLLQILAVRTVLMVYRQPVICLSYGAS